MEKIQNLIDYLQEQFKNKVSSDKMLHTVLQIQVELLKSNVKEPISNQFIEVLSPFINLQPSSNSINESKVILPILPEQIGKNVIEKQEIAQPLIPEIILNKVDKETEIAKQILEQNNSIGNKSNALDINDFIAESTIQTSRNNEFETNETSVSEKVILEKIVDIRKGISVNDRYLFINELFRQDENMYERSIKTINSFTSKVDAKSWIDRELSMKLGWNTEKELVIQFYEIVSRLFI